MKKLIYASALLAVLPFLSCGGDTSKTETTAASAGKNKAASADVNEADWELKDVSAIARELQIPAFSVKLPKDAQIMKDTSSLTPGLLVVFSNKYELQIQFKEHALMSQELATVIADSKNSDIGTDTTQRKTVVLSENANGYIFTTTIIEKGTGEPIGSPASHFSYFIKDKGDSYIVIDDSRYTGMVDNEEAFSAANTKKIWEIISGSAVFK